MSELYVAPYKSPLPASRRLPSNPSKTAVDFHATAEAGGFPYDIGDDPAFFSARCHNGPVTWGVCRADVRSKIQIGDWIAFLSFEQDRQDNTATRYRFVAALCVEDKLRHTALFDKSVNHLYRRYLNLLIRPAGLGWEHFEPALYRRFHWHDDWAWRMCERKGSRKKDVVAAFKTHAAGEPLAIGGRPLQVAENYVVFSTASAVLASDPPLVATHYKGDSRETWELDERSNRIRALIFENASRGLRTTNRQQPHRHFRRPLEDPDWPGALREAAAVKAPR